MTQTLCHFDLYRFRVDPSIGFAEAETFLQLALVALEGLYGEARVRLEARYQADEPRHSLTVDVRTPLGEALAQVFASLLIKEFGPDSFSVGRLPAGALDEGLTPSAVASSTLGPATTRE